MAESEVRWYGDEVSRAVREAMKMRLDVAARTVARQVQENIGTPAPPHSVPGQFPHLVSGDLQKSVRVETDKRSLTVRIVADSDHAEAVEASRPFLRRTLREMRTRLRAILLNGQGVGRYKFTE